MLICAGGVLFQFKTNRAFLHKMEHEIAELEHAECEFNVFLLDELVQKITLMNKKLDHIEQKVQVKHEKMMTGFKNIETAFHLLSGAIISMAEDLGTATGTIATDPWAFD